MRPPFTASFSCEREHAGTPCLPIRPLTVGFSAPLARALAEAGAAAQPTSGNAAIAPKFDKDDKREETQSIAFPTPLAETRYGVVLPAGLKDNAGRPLANAASFPLSRRHRRCAADRQVRCRAFGIVEREGAQRRAASDAAPCAGRAAPAAGGEVAAASCVLRRLDNDAEVLARYARCSSTHETRLSAKALEPTATRVVRGGGSAMPKGA